MPNNIDWGSIRTQFSTLFTEDAPPELTEALVEGVSTLAEAKQVLLFLTRVMWVDRAGAAVRKKYSSRYQEYHQAFNDACRLYEADHPPMMWEDWKQYTKAVQHAMLDSYDNSLPAKWIALQTIEGHRNTIEPVLQQIDDVLQITEI